MDAAAGRVKAALNLNHETVMIILPVETLNHVSDLLIIVLDDANLERMGHADPAEVLLKDCGKTLVNPAVMIAHQNSNPEFARILNGGDLVAVVKYLQRGWAFRPDKGDHNNGPQPLADSN